MNKLVPKSDDRMVPMSSTFCMNCVFAQYDDKKIQTGCQANRIEQFKNANIPVSEVTNDDTTSYIIEGKACVYYRNKTWALEYYKDIDKENLVSTIKQELKIPYHAIVFLRSHNTINELRERLSELHKQHIPPKLVTVVDCYTNSPIVKELKGARQVGKLIPNTEVATIITSQEIIECFKDYNFAQWRIQTIQQTELLYTDIIDLIYDNTKKVQYLFYISFESSYPIPASFSQELHASLHDDMKAFIVLLANSQNVGGGALKVAHAKHAGNSFTIPLQDKIKHYDDAPHLIKNVEEICPSLQMS